VGCCASSEALDEETEIVDVGTGAYAARIQFHGMAPYRKRLRMV